MDGTQTAKAHTPDIHECETAKATRSLVALTPCGLLKYVAAKECSGRDCWLETVWQIPLHVLSTSPSSTREMLEMHHAS